MKKYYYIFSRVILSLSTIYLIAGMLNLISISKSMIVYIFTINMILELIRLFLFRQPVSYEKAKISSNIIYANIIFCVLAVYFDIFFLKLISIILFSIIIILKIKDEYLNIK